VSGERIGGRTHLVFAIELGRVERVVRFLNHVLGRIDPWNIFRHADAHGYGQRRLAAHRDRAVLDLQPDPLRDGRGVFLVRVRQNDRKLVAAETRQNVDFADAFGQLGGDLLQQVVAGEMAVAVVDPLEIVARFSSFLR
jgi:hypothetical protein